MHDLACLLCVVQGSRVRVWVVRGGLAADALIGQSFEKFLDEVDIHIDVGKGHGGLCPLVEPVQPAVPHEDALFVELVRREEHLPGVGGRRGGDEFSIENK
jgi:hypothetical protein